MSEPTSKYNGDQNDRYGGRLQWPGVHGIPFMGDAAPSLKQHELDALPVAGRAYEKVFDLSKPEDAEYYNWVRDRIRNGMFTQDHINRRWHPEKLTQVIYLEWTQLYTLSPKHQPGNNGHGSTRNFTLRGPA